MRDNTRAIFSSPNFTLITQHPFGKIGVLRFSSVSDCHAFAKQYARTENEQNWLTSPSWIGLQKQTLPDFENSGIAQHPLALVKAEIAKLGAAPTRLGQIRPAIAGGYYDAPSVIAGVPLCARMRQRNKLPPLNIKITIDFSGEITAEKLAPITAKIAKALLDYTYQGGAISLFVCSVQRLVSDICPLCYVETRVNACDLANIATALSPVFLRSIVYPLETAMSDRPYDILPLTRDKIIPNCHYMTGSKDDIEAACAAVLEALRIS